MSHIDIEIKQLKEKLMEMWDLVGEQLHKGQEAMMNSNKETAKEVIKLERKVNNYDIKIDRMCENFFALFTPVAVDLRTVLAILKINANLERIGDTAKGIAYLVKKHEVPLDPLLLEKTQVQFMYEEAINMFEDCQKAFIENDTTLAKELIKRDKVLNKIYRKSDKTVLTYVKDAPEKIKQGLILLSIIKRLERVGDQVSNISEEIIFYREAKVVKHKVKKKKKE
ncbi:phosphate signaling complex protein PhoU [Echinicola jeungdonensis]|uniref:Phosphate-specific transport system accessory protein PhoU n=1 Tax=Echinicola jeungdonensis TaxID=709343 RepID=A0ABV5J1D1_9BACT|nr:phosphate signaling complex protein PhoU [Echinicola jeungdonensis]MDN3668464.1 phosphate signaling complex protein PhoU [Echinicola jeungdonensis]